MFQVFRVIAAIIAGILAFAILFAATEWICMVFYPPPPGFDGSSHEQICDYAASYPDWVLAIAAIMWGITVFVSTWVAFKVGGHPAAIVIEILLTALFVFNISTVPYVLWFKFAAVLAVGLGIFPFAFDATKRRPSPGPVPVDPA